MVVTYSPNSIEAWVGESWSEIATRSGCSTARWTLRASALVGEMPAERWVVLSR
jgi:hypothetical protein